MVIFPEPLACTLGTLAPGVGGAASGDEQALLGKTEGVPSQKINLWVR